MFGNLLTKLLSKPTRDRSTPAQDGRYAAGERLYELGLEHANRWESDKALEYFDLAYAANPHPAPLIDRAHIKLMRLRHYEALQDVLVAQQIDSKTGNEFAHHIRAQLEKLRVTTETYRNGLRNNLIEDLRQNNRGYVAEKILTTCFECDRQHLSLGLNPWPLARFHFFNELDTISKFDSPGSYPEIEEYIGAYPGGYVAEQVENCPDTEKYLSIETKLQTFLCAYEEQDMRNIRSDLLYMIRSVLWINEPPPRS